MFTPGTEVLCSPLMDHEVASMSKGPFKSPVDGDGAGRTDEAGLEWGWFEDFDDDRDLSDRTFVSPGDSMLYSPRGSLATSPTTQSQVRTSFDMCRTLPPLRHAHDTPYHRSKYPWVRVLPSHGHLQASIEISSFCVVETADSDTEHAEYLIEMRLDGRYFSRWRRFSAIARFVGSLDQIQFQRTLEVWQAIEASSRWFYRLDVDYLHRRCRRLEEFAHALLIECSNAHLLAELFECS